MKLSELSGTGFPMVRDYCQITDEDSDNILRVLVDAAEDYILSQTGLDADEADRYSDIVVAALVLIYDMYLNRTFAVDRSAVNPIADRIIHQHCKNLMANYG